MGAELDTWILFGIRQLIMELRECCLIETTEMQDLPEMLACFLNRSEVTSQFSLIQNSEIKISRSHVYLFSYHNHFQSSSLKLFSCCVLFWFFFLEEAQLLSIFREAEHETAAVND